METDEPAVEWIACERNKALDRYSPPTDDIDQEPPSLPNTQQHEQTEKGNNAAVEPRPFHTEPMQVTEHLTKLLKIEAHRQPAKLLPAGYSLSLPTL